MGVCMSMDEKTLQNMACGPKHGLKGKKELVMEMPNAEAMVCEILSRMPGPICTNAATFSACAYNIQGRKGINQDCMLVWEDFAAQPGTTLCGIFDGHGPSGHLVARKVRDSLPVLLALPLNLVANEVKDDVEDVDVYEEFNNEENCGSQSQDRNAMETTNLDLPHVSKVPDINEWRQKFVVAYKLMDRNLKSQRKLHCFDSGTTAVTMVVQDKDVIVGNVGDSRAILAKRAQSGSLVAHQLTTDLKPNLPKEMERIKSCRGRVFALEDEPDVARMWLPHSDMPGLAMARALGDFCLKEYGLSATPQIFHRSLTEEDEFIVLASDGIWDVLSNEEVVSIVASAYPRERAAQALVSAAARAWRMKHGVWRTDDCSAVCYFVKDKLTPTQTL